MPFRRDKYEKENKAFEQQSNYASNFQSHAVKSRSKDARKKDTIPADCSTGLIGYRKGLILKESVYGADFKGTDRLKLNCNEKLTSPLFFDLKGAESKKKIFGTRQNYTFLESQYKCSFTGEGVYRYTKPNRIANRDN